MVRQGDLICVRVATQRGNALRVAHFLWQPRIGWRGEQLVVLMRNRNPLATWAGLSRAFSAHLGAHIAWIGGEGIRVNHEQRIGQVVGNQKPGLDESGQREKGHQLFPASAVAQVINALFDEGLSLVIAKISQANESGIDEGNDDGRGTHGVQACASRGM